MRAIFAKIAALLAAMPRAVVRWTLEAGKWVSRLVFEQPLTAAMPAPLEKEAAEDQREDKSIAAIREAARALRAGQVPAQDVLSQISGPHIEWLLACSPQMLVSIERADTKALRDHIAGRKSLRGVLITDPATVATYRRPVMTDSGMVDEDDLAWQPAL